MAVEDTYFAVEGRKELSVRCEGGKVRGRGKDRPYVIFSSEDLMDLGHFWSAVDRGGLVTT